ncbi:acetyl-CoA carboxylase biotin carboxyl carrier protein [soil metagenome]
MVRDDRGHDAGGPAAGAEPAARQGVSEGFLEEVLPALIARLGTSHLAELEVRSGDWRVRLRRDLGPVSFRTLPPREARPPGAAGNADDADSLGVARSPAVGYFSPTLDLVVGRPVRAGDALGRVDVLGVTHDVSSPVDGTLGRIFAEPGQAVEYGQPLALVDTGMAKG